MDAVPLVGSRVHQIDALRGLAVLMILFANIFAFAYPLEVAERAGLSQSMSFLSQLQYQLYELFIHGKFISLLTLLFGASLYLFWQHSQRSVQRLKARMLALLLIGLCHAVFVWSGDILLMYALVALGLLRQQVLHWDLAHQLRCAKYYLGLGLFFPVLIWLVPASHTEELAETANLLSFYTGSYSDQLWHQIKYLALLALDLLLISYWWFGGMMLLAIWAMQSDWQQLLKHHFKPLLLVAVSTALLPLLWTGLENTSAGLNPLHMVSDLCFALIYIRLFLFVMPVFPAFYQLLRRCGRCSLSLYLWQSLTMVLLFRWVYPAWFGSLDRWSLTIIAAIFISLQLLWVQCFYKVDRLWWFEQLYRWLSIKLGRIDQNAH